MEITRHFTATTIIVYKKTALLHLHKKLNIWLPPGGHIDRDELPEEAAVREIKEETGLDVELYRPENPIKLRDVTQLLRPMHLLLENINPFHQHIDFIYYATARTQDLHPQNGETHQLRWFTAKQAQQHDAIPENVKRIIPKAIHLLTKA